LQISTAVFIIDRANSEDRATLRSNPSAEIVAKWMEPGHKLSWAAHMDALVQVMEEHDIDCGAYYYTEIEGAHDAQAYLNQPLQSMAPEHYGLTLPFVSGIVICLLILYFGFRYLPR